MGELNRYSKTLTQDETQPAAQAMLYGIGLTDDDMKKAHVGIASMGYDGNTCNMHLNDLAKLVKEGIWKNDLVGLIFNTIGISDGMSNGTDGMRYSLFLYFLIFRRMTKIVCFIKIIVYWIFSLIFSSMPITQIFRCIYKTFLNHAC